MTGGCHFLPFCFLVLVAAHTVVRRLVGLLFCFLLLVAAQTVVRRWLICFFGPTLVGHSRNKKNKVSWSNIVLWRDDRWFTGWLFWKSNKNQTVNRLIRPHAERGFSRFYIGTPTKKKHSYHPNHQPKSSPTQLRSFEVQWNPWKSSCWLLGSNEIHEDHPVDC